MQIEIITLFPEMFTALDAGITGRAHKNGLIKLNYWNPRDFTRDPHRTVDDRPYGGGPGMVLKPEPLQEAIQKAREVTKNQAKVIYLSPQGRKLDQQAVQDFTKQSAVIFVAGRYEGIDERLLESEVDEEWSLGDYVLSGGELAVMVVIDAITRLLPGALGDAESAMQDSFMDGLLDCPHYTRPTEFAGMTVPEVLLSGDHEAIARWRLKQALGRTWQRRPDLLEKRVLTKEEKKLLDEFIAQ